MTKSCYLLWLRFIWNRLDGDLSAGAVRGFNNLVNVFADSVRTGFAHRATSDIIWVSHCKLYYDKSG